MRSPSWHAKRERGSSTTGACTWDAASLTNESTLDELGEPERQHCAFVQSATKTDLT